VLDEFILDSSSHADIQEDEALSSVTVTNTHTHSGLTMDHHDLVHL
jgi:hypothetical protein